MLFILVMDILNLMVQKASDENLLQPLPSRHLPHRISLYADDVVLFLRPVASDIDLFLDITRLFGTTSGLRCNVQKRSVFPIPCDDDVLGEIWNHLPWELLDFSCKYLGVPLLELGLLQRG